jgi:hypothetical protein
METGQPFESNLTARERLTKARELLEHVDQAHPEMSDADIADVLMTAAAATLGPGGCKHWLNGYF